MATILTLVGSLRADSTNRKLAELAAEQAPEGVRLVVHDGLDQIPFYSEELDGETPPPAAVALRDALSQADALLFITPAYNGGPPATVKNALDWLSRPYGVAPIQGKPVAAIGTALGETGGSFAHDALRIGAGIAGGTPLDHVTVSLPDSLARFTDSHPRDDADVSSQVAAAIAAIADAARSPQPAAA